MRHACLQYNDGTNSNTLKDLVNRGVAAPPGHIALQRLFAPVVKDKEIPLEAPSAWGRKLYGYKDWPELLLLPRVVLLAEAGSGKTKEFQAQCRSLQQTDKPAFFVRVEDLVDAGLDASLVACLA